MSNNEIKIDFKIKRKHLTIALIAIVATSLMIPYQIFAQNQTKDAEPPADNPPADNPPADNPPADNPPADTFDAAEPSHIPAGACVAWASNEIQDKSSWYAIMCRASVAGTVDKVVMTFSPAGYIVTGTGIEPIQQKGLGPGHLSGAGPVLTYDLDTPKSVASGTTFKIIVGHIINPSPGVPANYQVTVQTQTSSSGVIQTFPPTAPTPLELIDSLEILNNSVTGTDIADGSVTGTDIADGSVTGTDIAADTVTAADIATDAVTGVELAGVSRFITGTCAVNPPELDGTDDAGQGRATVHTSCSLGSPAVAPSRVIAFPPVDIENLVVAAGSSVHCTGIIIITCHIDVAVQNIRDLANIDPISRTWSFIAYSP